MSRISIVTILIALFISLQGCTGKMVMLKNDSGETAKCEVSMASAMMTGVLIRDHTMDECIKEYENKGYSKVNDGK